MMKSLLTVATVAFALTTLAAGPIAKGPIGDANLDGPIAKGPIGGANHCGPIAKGPIGGANLGGLEPLMRAMQNPKFAEKVGLSAEQQEKLKELKPNRAEMKALNDKVKAATERQSDLLKADVIDAAAVMAAIDEIWDAKKEIAKKQTARVITLKSVLSPEQISKAKAAMKAMKPERAAARKAAMAAKEKAKAAAEAIAPAAPAADADK